MPSPWKIVGVFAVALGVTLSTTAPGLAPPIAANTQEALVTAVDATANRLTIEDTTGEHVLTIPSSLSLTLAISGKAEIWSVEYDVVHDTGVEGGTIDGGCKAWIVANTLWIGMSAGEDVGQNILEHWEIDGYDNAAGDSK